jgi:hypothetical protein
MTKAMKAAKAMFTRLYDADLQALPANTVLYMSNLLIVAIQVNASSDIYHLCPNPIPIGVFDSGPQC